MSLIALPNQRRGLAAPVVAIHRSSRLPANAASAEELCRDELSTGVPMDISPPPASPVVPLGLSFDEAAALTPVAADDATTFLLDGHYMVKGHRVVIFGDGASIKVNGKGRGDLVEDETPVYSLVANRRWRGRMTPEESKDYNMRLHTKMYHARATLLGRNPDPLPAEIDEDVAPLGASPKEVKAACAFLRVLSGKHPQRLKMGLQSFMKIIPMCCSVCQAPSGPGHWSCVDREDPDGDYEEDNCWALCNRCNMRKGLMTKKEFLDHIDVMAARAAAAAP